MRNINLLPEDKKENEHDSPDAQLDAKEIEALDIAHGIRSTRHLVKLAEKEGVDIENNTKHLCELLNHGNEANETCFQLLDNIIGRVILDIIKTLADAGVNIPPAIKHELENNRFMAFRGTVE